MPDATLVHRTEKFFPHGFASPERNDFLAVDFPDLFRNHKGCSFATVEYAQIIQRMAAQLRVSRRSLGGRAALANNQLTIVNTYCFIFHKVLE